MNLDTDLALLREFTSEEDGPSQEARDHARAVLLTRAQRETSGPKRRVGRWSPFPVRLEYVAVALSALVVVAVAAVFLSPRGPTSSGSPGQSMIRLVYQAEPTRQTPVVTRAALARAVAVMRVRVTWLGGPNASIRTSGANTITVQLPTERNLALAKQQVSAQAHLYFYDWEANALTPNGQPVAIQLNARDASALLISQGHASLPPGSPDAGSMSLYDAVKLASMQPLSISSRNSRLGAEYYLFGNGGSRACTAAARFHGVSPGPVGSECLLSGPDDSRKDLRSGLPSGVSASQGQQLTVKQGTTVLQAMSAGGTSPRFGSPNARYYVLKDRVAMFGDDITNPEQGTDKAGSPDVKFGLTRLGANEFQRLTAGIARRGMLVSGIGQTLDQHYAVALDNQLLTVPPVDFAAYPTGIQKAGRIAITEGLTTRSARDLATELRLGALPIRLKLISEKQIPATRGSTRSRPTR